MDDGGRSFKIVTRGLGTICVQPQSATAGEIERTKLVIYPHRISSEQIPVAVEWAAASQSPVFCHHKDIERLVKQGFGAYRFHGISGYKEIAFEGGTIEMFPARRERISGIRGRFLEFSEIFGFLQAPSFHLLIHCRGEGTLLYLSSVNIDSLEWKVLTRRNPAKIVGAAGIAPESWKRFGEKMGKTIISARQISEVSIYDSQDQQEKTPWAEVSALPSS